MRSLLFLASLSFLLAGCADGDAPAAAVAAPEPQWVEMTTEETRTVQAMWVAWGSACVPVVNSAGAFVGGAEEAKFDVPENLTGLQVQVTWAPTNPTANAVRAYVYDGSSLLATAEGPSPLLVEVEDARAAEVEGSVSVYLDPASCPTAPANAAVAPDQALDVTVAFRHLAQG